MGFLPSRMPSLTLRRVCLRPGIFSTLQSFSAYFNLSPNQYLALAVQRNFATASTGFNSKSIADSEPELESKSKSRSRKAVSSAEVVGKDKAKKNVKRRAKEAMATRKVTIRPQDRPPKPPGTPYTLWFSDWSRSQPKPETLEAAQNNIKQGAQIWWTISEFDKQRYREKYDGLRADYNRRIQEWREQVDPVILRELNRRRVAKGLSRIRGPSSGRPMPGFFRYFHQIREENPRTQESQRAYLTALAGRASSQWKAMSDSEKAKYNDPAKADFAAWREKRKAEGQVKQ
ncbi:hypothetical protein B0F90DRAFT_1724834 [Multifurca ochricompacta]|uniref:HMG box domain-containing protein n=1 Tax=Multifurca ochricompacta TaxID=376703 RepID=A0AAD4M3J5_9AGAM|nr:hypothetical protein B0F90DRAFT_1724834 [Multifurca ochricompacta]